MSPTKETTQSQSFLFLLLVTLQCSALITFIIIQSIIHYSPLLFYQCQFSFKLIRLIVQGLVLSERQPHLRTPTVLARNQSYFPPRQSVAPPLPPAVASRRTSDLNQSPAIRTVFSSNPLCRYLQPLHTACVLFSFPILPPPQTPPASTLPPPLKCLSSSSSSLPSRDF